MSIIKVHVAVIITLIVRCDILLASKDLWPSGSYSLPKPKSGCPNSWKEGWLRQDLEDDAKLNMNLQSKLSSSFHMNASLGDHEFVERTFCTKIADTIERNPWPKGFYCIYRKQSCPHPMVEGSILWDDEDSNNGNYQKGDLPDLDISGGNTKLYYCCQNQGKWHKSIELPNGKPFYLLPYGSRNCQRVMGAVSSLEYIIYDTEDDSNGDDFEEHHVFTDEVKSLPKIFYCYYEGCQYKLENNDGSFQPPKFPNSSYPDFQFCSWSITVNITSQIVLKFQALYVPDCKENSLDIYDEVNGNGSTLLARFCGENATLEAIVTSTTNNLYIFLKSGNNSERKEEVGFFAEYEAFQPATASPATTITTIFINSTNSNTFDSGRQDLQNTSIGNSAIYLSIILPILAILILLGVLAAIFYWRRRNKENDAASPATQMEKKENEPTTERYVGHTSPVGHDVTSKTTTNPICDSEVNSEYENDTEAMEMHNATDNILYEPGNELFEGNPIYQGVDNDVDSTYAEPIFIKINQN